MITIYSGKPGTGKSLKLADTTVNLLLRNRRWYKRTGVIRQVAVNLKLSDGVEKAFRDFIRYWSEPMELVTMDNVDIVWDEISTHLDSTQWANTPLELKRFLQQHRKKGIDIYGSTQTFATIDIAMRRLVDELWMCRKVFGSRNPSPTKPPVTRIWGLIWLVEYDPLTFEDEKPKRVGWDWLIIEKDLVDVYDTTQEIQVGRYPPLRHTLRTCSDPKCGYVRVIHS